jgi:hypothetical protein
MSTIWSWKIRWLLLELSMKLYSKHFQCRIYALCSRAKPQHRFAETQFMHYKYIAKFHTILYIF